MASPMDKADPGKTKAHDGTDKPGTAAGSATPVSGAVRAGGAPLPRFGFLHLVDAIAEYAKSARCENDLNRLVVLERMRQEFGTEPEVLLERGFDKAYRQIMEGV